MTRIRVTGGPWPERIGCEGRIVEAHEMADAYPFNGLTAHEAVILLDDDPITAGYRADPPPLWIEHLDWTCTIKRSHIEVIR